MRSNPYAARVARGAAYLDAHRPGWHDRIDVKRLLLQQCARCIWGQLVGAYSMRPEELDHETSWELGFVLQCNVDFDYNTPGDHDAQYALLTAAWREAIADRQAQCPPPARLAAAEVVT